MNSHIIPAFRQIARAGTIASSSGIGTDAHPFVPEEPSFATQLLVQHSEWYNLRMAPRSGSIETTGGIR